jgi:hypothetical protein
MGDPVLAEMAVCYRRFFRNRGMDEPPVSRVEVDGDFVFYANTCRENGWL